MGGARIKSGGQLKSVVTRDSTGAELARFAPATEQSPSAATAPAREPLPEPSFLEEVGHAGTALARWIAAGVPIAPPEVRAARYEICLSCEHWSEQARFGAGKCKHPKCGCTRLKFRFATEKCPADKWSAVAD